ncbi:MAG TPA: methyltransferase domain-containing protein [Vicinamibacterales bacterium]|nr:methyltransferase domain-containing protein [Vicinamibacterales bacterium]
MSVRIEDGTTLAVPPYVVQPAGEAMVAIDPARPHWIVTDERGGRLLALVDGRRTFAEVVRAYAAESGLDVARAWLHAETFLDDLVRRRFAGPSPGPTSAPYAGRAAVLALDRLHELWLHLNDFCNLACDHCLVSSGPDRDQGPPGELFRRAIDEGVRLGVARVFFTGGEPLARPDAIDLARHVTVTHGRDLVIMTNGTLLRGDRLAALAALPRERLRLQISLDGSRPETNDPIRGAGSFARIVAGVRAAVAAGLRPTLSCAVMRSNLDDLDAFVRLAADLGVRNVHLLWPHRRGRALAGPLADLPSALEILPAVRRARAAAREAGVTIDNLEEFRLRFDGSPGVKNDLAAAGWTSLCVYTDGHVYPSASFAGEPGLACGSLRERSLEAIWRESPILAELREATVERKPICRDCALKFLCGGGDIEHGYWASLHERQPAPGLEAPSRGTPATDAKGAPRRGSFLGHDPYCDLYRGLAADTFADLAAEARAATPPSGFDRPVVLRSMGERLLHPECSSVRTTRSACVLSEEVIDRSRLAVRDFYAEAAKAPPATLCCPTRPGDADLAHIPAEVVERFYGCGSPVAAAALLPGETFIDLGCGAGIDCFVAAKYVGPAGRAIGVDMTPEMLEVAEAARPRVAAALGYDAVEFRRGFLEALPVGDAEADVVTSNCVVNLSADKPRVFREIWRVLKDHGRAVIADIVADREVPPRLRADGRLWGECIGGALSEGAFLAAFERAGFHGVTILGRTFWREIEGCRFFSITVRGYKQAKSAGCRYIGQYATYLGPMKAVVDDEGHLFPRGRPVEVCTDTAARLARPPYAGSFVVTDGDPARAELEAGTECCAPGISWCGAS